MSVNSESKYYTKRYHMMTSVSTCLAPGDVILGTDLSEYNYVNIFR